MYLNWGYVLFYLVNLNIWENNILINEKFIWNVQQ